MGPGAEGYEWEVFKMEMWNKEARDLGITTGELCMRMFNPKIGPKIEEQAREIGDPWRHPFSPEEEEEEWKKCLEEMEDEAKTQTKEQEQGEEGRAGTESEGKENEGHGTAEVRETGSGNSGVEVENIRNRLRVMWLDEETDSGNDE